MKRLVVRNNGCVDWTYSGMALNKYGWWKYNNGFVDFGYNGIALNDYGWWKFTNGSVDFNANGLVFDEATNNMVDILTAGAELISLIWTGIGI